MREAEGRLILCGMKLPQTGIALPAAVAILTAGSIAGHATQASRTLVTVLAHADDEGPIAPLLARYARQGVQVYMIVVSDGQAGAGQQGHIPRPEVGLTAEELATVRGEEARCAAASDVALRDEQLARQLESASVAAHGPFVVCARVLEGERCKPDATGLSIDDCDGYATGPTAPSSQCVMSREVGQHSQPRSTLRRSLRIRAFGLAVAPESHA